MKYESSPPFKADYKGLSDAERRLFKDAVRKMNEAYDQRGDRPIPQWPQSLRIKAVEGAQGVFEMTWSFRAPDGRATFEYVTIDAELAIRWRRIGTHRIFNAP